ncbi:Vomp family autotransporter [Bartonella queenslandensis]|uniref:Vomp family autotransporter n=1 Tax=Bartonella queenslandensis TaxID=481138 RepID=UPI001BA7E8CB|nr:Vomp family autotransporter [Bartonella queenslandensis]
MKKSYAKLAGSELKFSRFPFIKVVSLTSIVALLSSVSPVFSENLVSEGRIATNIESAVVAYPQSVISVYDDATGYLGPINVSNSNDVTILNTAPESKVSVLSGYTNFLIRALSDGSDDNFIANTFTAGGSNQLKKAVSTEEKKKQSIISPQLSVRNNLSAQPFNQDGGDTAIMNASDISQDSLSPAMQRDVSENNVIFGNNTQAKVSDSVVIGSKAQASLLGTDQNLGWTVVIGSNAEVYRGGTVAVGNSTLITKDAVNAIVLGRYARAEQKGAIGLGYGANGVGEASIAIGYASQAKMNGSIAIGSPSQLGSLGNDINPNDDANKDLNRTKALGEKSIAIGSEAFANGEKSLAIGSLAKSEMEHAISIGPEASALAKRSLAIGSLAKSEGEHAVSIGSEASALGVNSMALGLKSQAKVDSGVAIGAHSVAEVAGSATGYSPLLQAPSEDASYVWRSTLGAVSVGDNTNRFSRQITGVAAGKEDTDAVNIAQLKDLQNYVNKGWKLSVNGNNGKVVGIDGTVDFAAGSSNLNVTKGEDDNKIKFDLAKDIALDSIKAGANTLNAMGLVIANGPQITTEGINAGGKRITGVVEGTDETDAVNFAQLQKVEKQVAASSFVKQDDTTRYITIGKHTDGDKIDITNSKSEKRIFAGIKDGDISKDSNEAVTGSQLFRTNQNVTMVSNNLQTAATSIAETFGGGAEYKDGTWKVPTFMLKTVDNDGEEKDETYHNVAEALSGVGQSFTNIQNKITNEISNQINNAITKVEGESFIQQDKETKRLTIGAKTEGTEINIANANGASRIISGVEDAKNNNDAVNKGQLDKGIENVSKDITNKFNDFTQNITHITQQVQGDALLWNESDGAFVAQHGEEKAKSKLKYLLNGDITADSTDAINGSQLYSMGNNLAGYFGGGAEYKDGEWKAPTFTLNTVNNDGTVSEEKYNTVEQALSAVGTSFTNIQNKITNDITNEINKTKGDALSWDNEKEAFVAQHGQERANSKITFLANGDISEKSTDAINGSQLYSVIDSLSRYFGGDAGYQNGEWKVPTFYVSQFKDDGNGDKKTGYDNVAGAFEGVNESMKSINERINNVTQSALSNGLNWNEKEQAFDARHNDQDSKITHVADGKLSKDSKEAVNGSQLWETNNRVSNVENRVDNIDQQVKDIANTVTNDAVKYDKNEKGEKINKVTLVGVSESDPVVLNNVKDGELSKDSKEAVNGSQLWETNQQMKIVLDDARKYTDERFNSILNNQMGDVINEAKSYTDRKFDALNYSIEGVRKEARQAAAIGLAVSNLRYNETPGKLSVGFGSGLWRNQSAFAFGAGYASESGSVLSNVSVTNSGGHWGIGAGFNMTLN